MLPLPAAVAYTRVQGRLTDTPPWPAPPQVPEQSRSLLGDGVGSSSYIRYLTQASLAQARRPGASMPGVFRVNRPACLPPSRPRRCVSPPVGRLHLRAPLAEGTPKERTAFNQVNVLMVKVLPSRTRDLRLLTSLQTKAYSQILARIVAGQRKNRFVQEG